MKFCPACGSPVEPHLKFCTNCGASLVPDQAEAAAPASAPQPVVVPAVPGSGKSLNGLVAIAGVVIIIAGIVLVAYPMITGSSVLSAAGIGATPPPTPTPMTSIPPESSGGSWVSVETLEPTSVPTTVIPTATTVVTTSSTPTPAVTATLSDKPLICTSDQVKCNNKCVVITTDNNNCGGCGIVCPSNQYCLNSNCVPNCAAGEFSCPTGCFNLMTNPDHCGTCNNNCPAGLLCVEGGCRLPSTLQAVPI